MTKVEANKRIEKLKKEIHHHRYLYHVKDTQEISDGVLDSLKKELENLEKEFPEFLTPDSPSQRVGGRPLSKFKKVPHAVQQWSFNDAFDDSEVKEFEERTVRFLIKAGIPHPKLSYTVEPKIDGLHVVLTYKKGILVTGATRGDGVVGEDVTQNLQTIESIPLKLEQEVDIIAEGEVWLSRKQFAKINKERDKKDLPLYANPRNSAAGAIRQLDPAMTRSRKLDCYIYKLSKGDENPATQIEALSYLKKIGFKVNPHFKKADSVKEVISYWRSWEKKKESEPYWIDGVVVKVNSGEYQNKLGYTGKAPRHALALKFAPDQTTTVVEDISVQVGRTGALTPVAHLRPVFIAGSTVRRATLHNEDEIRRLGVKIGDTVIIQKAGDIIPDVVEVLIKLRTGKEKKFHMPMKCPMCGGRVEKKKDEVALYCLNKNCFAKRLAGMTHFVAKGAFNIVGLGGKLIEKLMNAGLIETPADIFTVKKDDLALLEGLGEKSADNIIKAVTQAKKIARAAFIFSLGIRFVGAETAELVGSLCMNSKTPSQFQTCVSKNSLASLEEIEGIGEKSAKSIYEWFNNNENRKLIKQLDTSGIRFIHSNKKVTQGLIGTTYVLTGSLVSMTRDEAKAALKARGAKVSSNVSKQTTGVIAGGDPGSKKTKAKKLGVPILSETDLKKILKSSL
jgi:DNA ligase (NAD+)